LYSIGIFPGIAFQAAHSAFQCFIAISFFCGRSVQDIVHDLDAFDLVFSLHAWSLSYPSGTIGESGDLGSYQIDLYFDPGHHCFGLFIEDPGFSPQCYDP
jgi:hypothetical protein